MIKGKRVREKGDRKTETGKPEAGEGRPGKRGRETGERVVKG
jgi:hypothetical protein